MSELPIPEGFTPIKRLAPFLEMLGPVYIKTVENSRIVALRIAEKHLNMRRIAHGGMLVSLADSALGINLSYYNDPPKPMVTVNLSTDFMEPALLGEWVEAHVNVQRFGKTLAFASCNLKAGAKGVLRASGVFAILPGTVQLAAKDRFDG